MPKQKREAFNTEASKPMTIFIKFLLENNSIVFMSLSIFVKYYMKEFSESSHGNFDVAVAAIKKEAITVALKKPSLQNIYRK